MPKEFNVNGTCFPSEHYMVDISDRLSQIKAMVDKGNYFCINKGRQYGKTTTFSLLKNFLAEDYCVFSISFEGCDDASFENLDSVGRMFFSSLESATKRKTPVKNLSGKAKKFLERLNKPSFLDSIFNSGRKTFDTHKAIIELCSLNEKPIVVFIDEVDQAGSYESFLKFLGLLRDMYLERNNISTFHSIILAGVYDVKNLKLKLRPTEEHQYNSPWNIAADFNVKMEFDAADISTMLQDYENDHRLGINIGEISELLEEYTGGYPYLVSRMCMIIDGSVSKLPDYDLKKAWTKQGVLEAVKLILKDENTLFDDMRKKLDDFPGMRKAIFDILYEGKTITFNAYDKDLNVAKMFCFIKDENGKVAVANRIFEVWFYNLFVSEASKSDEIFSEGSKDKVLFIKNGELDMPLILERFIVHFNDIYGDKDEKFVEKEGRKYFLFFIKPIINGTGNYYIEAQTRDERRTDVIIDYLGHQYVVELKIWHGAKYNENGENQLIEYLDSLHKDTGYMLTFNFNKNKSSEVKKTEIQGKTVYEAFV
ncbi:MAG: AAA-like domain-containing protein [Treponema sp.]|nr:AAA-like domain-containing protein [Candidatus Treponema equifaecale]